MHLNFIRSFSRLLFLAVLATLVVGCARYKPMYDSDKLEPTATSQLPIEEPVHSVYFTGSTGGLTDVETSPALELLDRVLAKADEKSTMIFLGDQIDPNGFPSKKSDKAQHKSAKQQVRDQLSILEDFQGTVAMTHGNQDWATGIEGAERLEDYLKKQTGKDILLPENACGDPVLVELSDEIGLLIINSQWFISDWSEHEEINEGCAVQSRKGFRWRMANMIKGVAFKHVVVAMHHPIISRGPRGGEHGLMGLFKDGYLGPFYNWWRSKVGVEQDLYSPKMEELRDMLKGLFDEHPAVTFVSGHEHLLQYGEFKRHPVVGSGTAVRVDPGKVGQRTVFTAGVPGFAEIHYYANGEAWLKVREADGSPFGKTLFEKKLYTKPLEKYEGDFELFESDQDSIQFAPFAGYRKFGPLYKWAFGNNNRELFETPYTYPILRLDQFAGGVEVTKRGGGGQTNSLRLTDKQGRDYALRSIRKDPTRLLPAQARVGPLIHFTQDLFFTANPFGALTAANIAEGVDIPHAYPRLVYLPAHPQLGDLNASFADDLYLLEERPNNEWIADEAPFGTPLKIDGRDDVMARIQKSYKDQMDQEALVRARLLDVLLGDFDRHSDQWRFAKYKDKETGVNKWRVIPRDRDQAILNIDGVLLKLGGMTIPAVREVQNFDKRQPWIKDFTFQARMMDRRYLNELSREEWLQAAQELQTKLTDTEIESAFDDWPKAAQEGRKEKYIAAFKARRADLVRYAEKIYTFLAKEVYIVGTDRDDFFDVRRKLDGSVTVDVFDFKGQKKGERYYHRTFYPSETNSVQLFGLREEDRFEVSGTSKNPGIKVRIIPGPEEDAVATTDATRSVRRRTRVYAWPGQDKLDLSQETEKHLTKYWRFNQYDYRDVNFDYGLWLPNFGFNIDDGIRLGLSYQEHYYTFHRHFKQSVGGLYATSSQGLQLKYNFSIIDLAPRLDLNIDALYQTPNYAVNFFGYGNETLEESGERRFYRIRQEVIRFAPSLFLRNKNHDGGFRFTLLGESAKLDRDIDRSLGQVDANSPLFDRAWYAEAKLAYSYENVDDTGFPRDGLAFNVEGSLRQRTTPETALMPSFRSSLTVYQHLWKGAALVGRVGAGVTSGNFYFYDAQTLGAGSLRGYRRERFIGEARFYSNFDLRQEFSKKAFRSRLGVFASYDKGRVWYTPEENSPKSDIWHTSYGGGFFIRPLSLFTLSTGYYIPEDDSDPVVRIVAGFDF